MDWMYEIIRESVSGGLWKFLGCLIMVSVLLGLPLTFLINLINRILRHWGIRKHGYPPPHCDADGDFKS